MNLVLLTLGDRIENHYQAYFSIVSFLKSSYITKCCIITDKPQFYMRLKDTIDLIEVDDTVLQEWRGPHDFFWRIKIKALEAAAVTYPNEDILYVDTDTFLASDLSDIAKGLAQGQVYMHQNEGLLCQLKSKTEKSMWHSLAGKQFESITISEKTAMWNAGVIAISGIKAAETIKLALKLCDDICETNCPRRLVEQFSFSLALSEQGKLTACTDSIVHYWGNKAGWDHEIQHFFLDSYLQNHTLEREICRIREFDYKKSPIILKEKQIKMKLYRLINKLIPAKTKVYFN